MPEKKATNTKKNSTSNAASESMQDLYTKEAASGSKGGKKSAKTRAFSESYRVLIRPLVTEKAARQSTGGKYTFVVAMDANKIMVARSIEAVYGVKPESVRIVRLPGKTVRRGRITGKRSSTKKAIVTLPKGETIQIYEGV